MRISGAAAWILLLCVMPGSASGAAVNEGVFAPDRLNHVLGQDGVTPIPVKLLDGSGAYLWTFGDTILGGWKGAVVTTATLDFSAAADMKAMPSNTMALTPVPSSANYRSLDFSFYAPGGKIAEFIGYKPGENPFVNRLWAAGGTQAGGFIYVYFMEVAITTAAPGGFVFKGTGLARAPVPQSALPGLAGVRKGRRFPGRRPGRRRQPGGQGKIYLYTGARGQGQ